MTILDDVRRSPNVLAGHYSRFRVEERLLLTGHSHQAWPDVAEQGQLDAFRAAAEAVDGKWGVAAEKAAAVVAGYRELLGDPAAEIALGQNTHELLIRLLSALDLQARPRIVTTDGEFHSARRQLTRLAEAGLDVVRIAADPVDTLAERVAAAVDHRTAAVLVSHVLFETARIVEGLDAVAAACAREGAELVVDAYHALGVLEVSLPRLGLQDAWVVGGGYKYLQLGEGNCFLRVPAHADRFRPLVTGWYAEFGELAAEPDPARVGFALGAGRWAGATYDPTSHFRAARVLAFRDEQGLRPPFLRKVAQHQLDLLATAFDALDLPPDVATRDRSLPVAAYGGFLALACGDAAGLQRGLAERGVRTDSRGHHLRLGPAPYLADRQLLDAVAALGEVARTQHRL